jgi:serine/threonine protein kinase
MAHEGLIRLLDTGVADGQAYIVMELVEGATLSASLRSGPLGARLTAKLGTILGGALDYVHSAGIVHRDVKPSNILLGNDGRALLGDFGIARFVDATTFTVDGTTIGTVAYMAPEQLEDHGVGPAADIWSLGMVLLECLTGRRIYEGTSAEIIARRLAGPVPLPGDLPVPWKLLLSGMLDHRPEQRLDGGQVASMLTSPAYSVPWTPGPESETGKVAPTAPLDLTALEPGRQYQAGATVPVAVAGATQVAPAGVVPPPPPIARSDRHRPRRVWPAVLGVVIGLAAAGLVAYEIDQHTGGAPPAAGTTTTTHAPATTTTSTSTTTTTTTTQPPTPSSTLGQLVADVTSGEQSGSVQQGIGQSLTQQAQQAVTDEQSGSPQQAANDLQQAATIISDGEQNGTISQQAATTLQNDLNALASTLGLGAASQAPTTTTTAPGSGPGLIGPAHKHGGGGNGPG